MLYGELQYNELILLLRESLSTTHGDVVEIDRDLAEQLCFALQQLVAMRDEIMGEELSSDLNDAQLGIF